MTSSVWTRAHTRTRQRGGHHAVAVTYQPKVQHEAWRHDAYRASHLGHCSKFWSLFKFARIRCHLPALSTWSCDVVAGMIARLLWR